MNALLGVRIMSMAMVLRGELGAGRREASERILRSMTCP